MDILPFTISVDVEQDHLVRSQMLGQPRSLTVNYNPVALALKDKLAELAIPFTDVHFIIEPDGLRYCSNVWGIPFKGKRYAFQADKSPDFASQWVQFCTGQRLKLTFTLDFYCIGEDKPLEALPKKPYSSRISRCFLYAVLAAFVLWLNGFMYQGPSEVLGTVGAMVVFLHPKNLLTINDPDATW